MPTGTRLTISPYYYKIENYIQFDLINYVAYNIAKADIYGIEMEASHVFAGGWSSFVNYTFQKSRTEGDAFKALFVAPEDWSFNQVPGLPDHRMNAGIQYKIRKDIRLALFALIVFRSESHLQRQHTLQYGPTHPNSGRLPPARRRGELPGREKCHSGGFRPEHPRCRLPGTLRFSFGGKNGGDIPEGVAVGSGRRQRYSGRLCSGQVEARSERKANPNAKRNFSPLSFLLNIY